MTTEPPKLLSQITRKVKTRKNEMTALVERMDRHYRLWRMNRFTPDTKEGVDPEDAHTTNLGRSAADKVVFGIASSHRVIRVENDAAWQAREDSNDNLERLAIGMLNLADKRLEESGDTPVQDQLGWFAPVRGRYVIARALLRKDAQGETVVDITPFDPRNFVFDRGADGIKWCAYITMQTRSEIRDKYKNFRFDSPGAVPDMDDDGSKLEEVIDYYEPRGGQAWNGVIIDEKWAKPLTNTFAVKWPIIMRAVGSMPSLPNVAGTEDKDDTSVDFGPSIFTLIENVIPEINRVTSYRMTIVAQQADRAYKVSSRGGNLSFDSNPTKKGSEVTLDSDANQDVEPYPPPQTGGDADSLTGQMVTEFQAGTLAAHALSGQPPPGGLSAAAIRLLGSNLTERTRPFLKPVESCLLGCLEALIAQYETGRYREIRVFGKTFSEQPFDRVIRPEDIAGHGNLQVSLKLQLPQDDQLIWATARMATEPNANGESLVDMDYAREKLLDIQDSSLIRSKLAVQRAKTQSPILALMDMLVASQRRGETATATYIDSRIGQMLLKEWMEQQALLFSFMQQMGTNPLQAAAAGIPGVSPNGIGNGTSPGPGGIGLDPQVASVEQFAPGTTGSAPSPDAGLNTTAPRPGAQSDINARLAAIGLERG